MELVAKHQAPVTAPARLHILSHFRSASKSKNGIQAQEAIMRAEKNKLVLVSNMEWDKMLVGSDDWKKYRNALPVWTGTKFAHVTQGISFEKGAIVAGSLENAVGTKHFIAYFDAQTNERHLFPVPPKYLGMTNALLVSEHSGYKTQCYGNDRILVPRDGMELGKIIKVISSFPEADTQDRSYEIEQNHGIPGGSAVFTGKRASLGFRNLSRNKWAFVSFVVRSLHGRTDHGIDIIMDMPPCGYLGAVAQELPRQELPVL